MDAATFVAIFLPIFVAIFLFFLFLPLNIAFWRAEQDRESARRLADAKMNARLLRLNI